MERRDFLKVGVAGLGSSFVLGGVCLPKTANAATVVVDLSVQEVVKTVLGNREILTWQYVNLTQASLGALGSSIVVTEGDVVTINVQNNLSSNYNVNIVIPGLLDSSPSAPVGGVLSFTFTATKAGSYIYYDDSNGDLGRAMGLMGPLVVLPIDGSKALTPGEFNANIYDRDYTLVLNELDSRINDAVAAGLPFDLTNYQPDYFFVNGLSYPDTALDSNGVIDDSKVVYMLAGENVAIRFLNGGLIYYPMHFHGYHVNVINRNRWVEKWIVEKDTVLVRVGECVDTMLSVGTQVGLYPLHTHYIPGVTSSGFYSGGGLMIMKAV